MWYRESHCKIKRWFCDVAYVMCVHVTVNLCVVEPSGRMGSTARKLGSSSMILSLRFKSQEKLHLSLNLYVEPASLWLTVSRTSPLELRNSNCSLLADPYNTDNSVTLVCLVTGVLLGREGPELSVKALISGFGNNAESMGVYSEPWITN